MGFPDPLVGRGGCHVELIMKDISTVRYDHRRLWEWSEIANEFAVDRQSPENNHHMALTRIPEWY